MMIYIDLKKEDRKFIAKALDITERTIFNAVHFTSMNAGSDLYKKIRTLALQRGGEMRLDSPLFATIFDSDGTMHQYFPNGAEIRVDKKTGLLEIFDRKGELKRSVEKCSFAQIDAEQIFAAGL